MNKTASKEQCLGHLSRLPVKEAMKILNIKEQGVKLILNTRRISQENMELLAADMVKRGIKVLEVEKPVAPNAVIAQPSATAQGPEEEGGMEEQQPPDEPEYSVTSDVQPAMEEAPTPVAGDPLERKLMICFASYRFTNPATMMAILGMWDRAKMMFALEHGTMIINARNRLADTFLRSGCDWSFWLDDDVICPFGNDASFRAMTGIKQTDLPATSTGANTILRLVNSARQRNAKIMSGLYYGRNAQGRAMFGEGLAQQEADRESRVSAGRDIVKPTAWAATGCLVVHKDVFLGIKQQNPKPDAIYPFFTPEGATGEDHAFGMRAARAGFKAYVDHQIVCGHLGHAVYTHKNTAWTATTR